MMKATYATVKSEADFHKRKTLECHVGKPPSGAKRARTDENADDKTCAFIEEMLERETWQFSCQRPQQQQHPQAGPTDFSGLFPKAAGCPPLGSCVPSQHTQLQRAARTFEDITTQRHSRQGQDQPLTSYHLPSPLKPMLADVSNFTGAAAATAALRDRQLPSSTIAPLDWSLKTVVRFTSPTPFSVAEEAESLGCGAFIQARRAFSSSDGLHSLSMQQQYLAALHSWQFPADPRSTTVAGAAKLRGVAPEVHARRNDWQSAFASLYDALRHGACDAFYYLSPEGTKKPFAVFFGAAGIGGRPRLHALLTRSTSGLRALLTGGRLGLGFGAPLLPADADRRATEDQSAVPLDGSQSLLVFEGGIRVHGIFDFLMNESVSSHGDECDVPLLLSPVQFLHASLRAFTPKVLGISDARDAGRALHRLELRATALPPWVLDRLAAVLAVTQDGNFSMACDTHQLTLALNWCPSSSSGGNAGNGFKSAPAKAEAAAAEEGGGKRSGRRQALCRLADTALLEPQQLTEYEARQHGCWDAEEAARWRIAVQGLSCKVVREIRCEGGTFSAKLSDKSAARIVL